MPFFPPEKRKPTPTHLYVMACRDAVKIGVAVNVEQRRRSIQQCCPDEVTVLAAVLMANFTEARAAEKQMHAVFAERRTFGEWFRMEPTDALNMLATFKAHMPPSPQQPEPQVSAKRRNYHYGDSPEMKRLRIAARALEF